MKFTDKHRHVHICMCPERDGCRWQNRSQRDNIIKVLSRQFQRYVNGFYPKSNVEVMAFQSFWYEVMLTNTKCAYFVCRLSRDKCCWENHSQRDTIRKLSSRRFQRYVNGFYSKSDVEVIAFQSFSIMN